MEEEVEVVEVDICGVCACVCACEKKNKIKNSVARAAGRKRESVKKLSNSLPYIPFRGPKTVFFPLRDHSERSPLSDLLK